MDTSSCIAALAWAASCAKRSREHRAYVYNVMKELSAEVISCGSLVLRLDDFTGTGIQCSQNLLSTV